MSLRLVEYSRMRPQHVQVRLHVCRGSSCRTMANFGVRLSLCLMMWPAIFAVNARGNRIGLVCGCEGLSRFGGNRGFWQGARRGGCRRRVPEEARDQEAGRRHVMGGVDAAAAC